MQIFNGLVTLLGLAAVFCSGLDARTRKGDKFLAQGHAAEVRKEWDRALELYEQALSQDPADSGYRLATTRARFQACEFHVDRGHKLRAQGQLAEALAEYETAYAIDASSSIAEQEVRRTRQMIDHERKKSEQPGPKAEEKPEEKGLTPAQAAKKEAEERIAAMLPVPELKPLNPQPINLKMNNQPAKVLFETVGKLAGINVLFDPEYNPTKTSQSIELINSTLEQALDYVAVITKSFWKPLSANTIFIANDNTTKRRDYEEQVMKVFYLTNVTLPTEVQEIVTAIRTVAEVQRIFPYGAQSALIVRGEADRIALAEKIVNDLDKPKPEVVIDIVVMEVNRARTRDLAAAVAPSGINQPVTFTPRQSLRTPSQTSGSQQQTQQIPQTSTGTAIGPIPVTNIPKIDGRDFSITLPGGLLQALMNDRGSKVLQSPQLRTLDGVKAQLRIGDKVPYATGSFQPGIGGVGINPLVNTQFQFLEVGVNLDITAKIHGADEVSLHVAVEISQVRDRINLGGVDQPVVGQRKIEHDIRIKEGEVNLMGGLSQTQETKTVTGVPGFSKIPLIRRLFTSELIDKNDSELLIALVPHIVRVPVISGDNLKGIAVGNATSVKLNYAPRRPAAEAPPSAPVTPPPTAAAAAAKPPQAPAVEPPKPEPAKTEPAKTEPAKPEPAVPTTRVVFVPSQVDTQVSSAVSVTLIVENATELFSSPLSIKFDPKVLRLNDIVRGNLLSSDGQQVVFTKNILNDTGDATVNLNRMPNTSGITGSGTLVTLIFQAVGKGTTTVTIPQLTLRNSKSEAILSTAPQLTVNVN